MTAFAAVAASPALGAPPMLQSVGQINAHPTATWTLPSGVQSRVAEVATKPDTSSDGYFFNENVKAFDTLDDGQTTWVYNSQLDPGTYYVHIGGFDPNCQACPVREFSAIKTLTITAPTPGACTGTNAFVGNGTGNPPVLTSVGDNQQHPTATWTFRLGRRLASLRQPRALIGAATATSSPRTSRRSTF